MTSIMTTGQVAQVFSVNINTVIKWFDEGKLAGFRLPKSNERRIYRESVTKFMTDHGITDELLRAYENTVVTRKRGRKPGSTNAVLAAARLAASAPAGAELRAFPRKPVDLLGEVTLTPIPVSPNGERPSVNVKNLSLGGAYLTDYVAADRMIPEEFRLVVHGTDGAPSLDTTCQVVHMRRTANYGITLGCRFTQVDPGALQGYLAQI